MIKKRIHADSYRFEVVCAVLVHEDVNEEHSLGLEPRRDACQERLVVLHVLKHLDGYHL